MKSVAQADIMVRTLNELITGFKTSVAHLVSCIVGLTINFKKLIPNFVKLMDRSLCAYAYFCINLCVFAEQILRQVARKFSILKAERHEKSGNLVYCLGSFLVVAFIFVKMNALLIQNPLCVCLAMILITFHKTITEKDAFDRGCNECSILNLAKVYPEVQQRIAKRWAQIKGDDIDDGEGRCFDDDDCYRHVSGLINAA